jgi:hypothetical protein
MRGGAGLGLVRRQVNEARPKADFAGPPGNRRDRPMDRDFDRGGSGYSHRDSGGVGGGGYSGYPRDGYDSGRSSSRRDAYPPYDDRRAGNGHTSSSSSSYYDDRRGGRSGARSDGYGDDYNRSSRPPADYRADPRDVAPPLAGRGGYSSGGRDPYFSEPPPSRSGGGYGGSGSSGSGGGYGGYSRDAPPPARGYDAPRDPVSAYPPRDAYPPAVAGYGAAREPVPSRGRSRSPRARPTPAYGGHTHARAEEYGSGSRYPPASAAPVSRDYPPRDYAPPARGGYDQRGGYEQPAYPAQPVSGARGGGYDRGAPPPAQGYADRRGAERDYKKPTNGYSAPPASSSSSRPYAYDSRPATDYQYPSRR